MIDETFRRLLGDERPELGCEECFAELPRYVEVETSPDRELELCPVCTTATACAHERDCLRMRAHLEGCAACSEEHEILRELVQTETHD